MKTVIKTTTGILFFTALLTISATTALCSSNETTDPSPGTIQQDSFKNCAFDFSDKAHVNHAKDANNGLKVHDDGICSFNLNIEGFHTMADEKVSLIIVSKNGSLIDQAIAQSGFEKEPGDKWTFPGNAFSIGKLIKYQKRSFDTTNDKQDTTLVGRQTEHGTDQTGTPMTFEGVHVLRLSSSYAISINMPFDPSTSQATRDEVVKDLVNLVNSVHSTNSEAPSAPN